MARNSMTKLSMVNPMSLKDDMKDNKKIIMKAEC